MEEKRMYKICACCGQRKRCEKQGLPSKEERLAKLKERAAKFKANTEKRLKREHLIALELEEML